MSTDRRFEQELPELLDDLFMGPMPPYRDHLLQQTSRTRQRAAWTLPERWLPMSAITLGRRALAPVPWRTIGLLALLALLVAAGAIYVGSTRQHVPAPFGVARNGVIAFQEQGDIALLDPLTDLRSVVVGGPDVESSPVFSRDGTTLAFMRGTDGSQSLWLADADGANQRLLWTGVDPSGIEWSPDGRSILTTSLVDSERVISIVPTDGGDAHSLDVGPLAEGDPMWRPPAGEEILFRGTTPTGFGLFAVRPDGTGRRPITESNGVNEWDALFFDWSPDGEHVAYQWRDGDGLQLLYVVPAAGGTRRAITTVESVGVQWSPDGTAIAFVDGEEAPRHVSVVAADGSGPTFQGDAGEFGGILWAPDGESILFDTASGAPLLLDLTGGPAQQAASSSQGEPTSWQRLAP